MGPCRSPTARRPTPVSLHLVSLAASVPTPSPIASAAHFRDFRALDAEPRHETLLAEDEGIGVLREGRRGVPLRQASVDDHHAWAKANFPAVRVVKILQGFICHEEQRVTEPLDADLQPVRARDRAVVADRLAIPEQLALAVSPTDEETRFRDLGKYQDTLGPRAHILGQRFRLVQLLQSCAGSVIAFLRNIRRDRCEIQEPYENTCRDQPPQHLPPEE